MNYGTSAYGAVTYGANDPASIWHVFFPLLTRPTGTQEARLEFNGSDEFFSVFSVPIASPDGVLFKVYTSDDEGETPQLQVQFSGIAQVVVGARRFITVTATDIDGGGSIFAAVGRAGD